MGPGRWPFDELEAVVALGADLDLHELELSVLHDEDGFAPGTVDDRSGRYEDLRGRVERRRVEVFREEAHARAHPRREAHRRVFDSDLYGRGRLRLVDLRSEIFDPAV